VGPITNPALEQNTKRSGQKDRYDQDKSAQAIVDAGRLQPDLVLLDLSMPGLDGLTALPRLREAAPDCEVVVLTASGTEENLLSAIRWLFQNSCASERMRTTIRASTDMDRCWDQSVSLKGSLVHAHSVHCCRRHVATT